MRPRREGVKKFENFPGVLSGSTLRRRRWWWWRTRSRGTKTVLIRCPEDEGTNKLTLLNFNSYYWHCYGSLKEGVFHREYNVRHTPSMSCELNLMRKATSRFHNRRLRDLFAIKIARVAICTEDVRNATNLCRLPSRLQSGPRMRDVPRWVRRFVSRRAMGCRGIFFIWFQPLMVVQIVSWAIVSFPSPVSNTGAGWLPLIRFFTLISRRTDCEQRSWTDSIVHTKKFHHVSFLKIY